MVHQHAAFSMSVFLAAVVVVHGVWHQSSVPITTSLDRTIACARGEWHAVLFALFLEVIMLQFFCLQHIVFPPGFGVFFSWVFKSFSSRIAYHSPGYEDATWYGSSLGVIVYFCILMTLKGEGQGHSIKFKVKFV